MMWEVGGGVGSGEAVADVLPNVMGPEVGTILAIVMGIWLTSDWSELSKG